MKMLWLLLVLIATHSYGQVLTTEQMFSDYDLLQKSMEEAHGGLYRFSTKQEMDDRFREYRKKIESIKHKKEFISLLYELVATTGDGHMRFELDQQTLDAYNKAPLFPFTTLADKNRMWIVFNDTKNDTTIRPGMELMSINNESAGSIVNKILPKIPHDGSIETGRMRRVGRTLGAWYWLFIDPTAEFVISVRDEQGNILQSKHTGVLNADRENNRKSNPVNAGILENLASLEGPAENISFRFLRNSDLAFLKIRGFQGSDFYSSIDSVFKILHDKKTRSLILDLRENGGGVDQYGAYLSSQFILKPFRYFDRIHVTTIQPAFTTFTESTQKDLREGTVADPGGGYLVTPKLHSGVSEQKPSAHPFNGQLFVLMDGGSFSTTADVLAMLRHHTKAVFIGQESGGASEGNTSGLNAQLRLPYSKLSIRIQMYEYFNAVPVQHKGRGTMPDHTIPKSITDLLKGFDAPLNRAIELATANQ